MPKITYKSVPGELEEIKKKAEERAAAGKGFQHNDVVSRELFDSVEAKRREAKEDE